MVGGNGGEPMDQRKRRVLQAVTDDYIATAEPVGSRTIARKYNLGVSPATIRNEMADLEEAGYLRQPHTSAGRIPSDLGYRFYVDALMSPTKLSAEERLRLRAKVVSRQQAIDQIFHNTARLLSLLTQYISIVLAPPMAGSACRHLRVVGVDPYYVLVVLVTEPGFIQNRMIEMPEPVDGREIARLNSVLNRRLRGVSLGDVTGTLIAELRNEIQESLLFEAVMELLEEGLDTGERVYLEGTTNLFEHPEFHDVERAKLLLQMLEEREALFDAISDLSHRSGITVTIGEENRALNMQDCSMVTATYTMNGQVLGSLGLLGPTRMDYARVVAAVEFMADNLSEILSSRL